MNTLGKFNTFQDVYDVVCQIPEGRVSSYGAVAAYLGIKNGARMVGWALNQPFIKQRLPAHRVVNRNGLLTGKHHFATPTLMQELLEKEGVVIKNDQIQNFDKIFWNPFLALEV